MGHDHWSGGWRARLCRTCRDLDRCNTCGRVLVRMPFDGFAYRDHPCGQPGRWSRAGAALKSLGRDLYRGEIAVWRWLWAHREDVLWCLAAAAGLAWWIWGPVS